MITILLLLSTFYSPNAFLYGEESHPTFGTEIIIFPSFLWTGNVLSPPKTGPWSAWPVLIENPALWAGQTTFSPNIRPFARGTPKWEHLDWKQ